MSESVVIAVDGPAASGKSTLARRLAAAFGLRFLDTGLLYRAVARRLLEGNRDPSDERAALEAVAALAPEDLDPDALAGERIGEAASRVAAMAAVREALLPWQRRFGRTPPGAVLAGRDIGTVVFPDATVKLFVTASLEERARRRFLELRRRGREPIFERVLDELRERDRRDCERSVAPLRVAEDAVVLDTTALDADAAFAAARQLIERELAARSADSSRSESNP
ncbi:MAG: (d)CMP kinase [Geminicoccaceae bacterium]|nr:(d)CMP kinase [Geminicoccaceae bacterium]MCS7269358.1 (d)CMP kinase [Geminicoccaceae bacterium]MCX7629846.1 (d)CMP kinase [Geminicoccaceae bacterium]MDW8126071.1 (d)CMP kinase [Geminicoccaceae bacterium]MDW8340877.1 (d)CMP kinase [Geminicoccaceae bacterium]